ncbi:FosG family fosfomycin resistance glutathione transferase [Aliiglaciecola sp. CAU 1673]|uniref:FosG family fosfomycin resistance glutathione transferase n=1 Tax=Aliiglaciecola sp. CAU 1673 TaxID=3032595 RepID=UPI0023DC3675|nr:FosG family fosfomycin resistance glutathione transferase [Aliiglaciecola sp. CAU 1673]MDF2178835.1 FosG family fosfomycin resistance glutathione transferase [Aliiglaciecola sp. CAU 1673]
MLRGLNHITIAVSDLERSLAFYTDVLGMLAHVRWNNGAYLSLGGIWFCLSCDKVCPSQDYSHIALDISEDDFALFTEKLRNAGVVEWKNNSSEGHSMYFFDPDGNKLEAHCGDLQSRLNSLKNNPYVGLVWL